MIYIVYECVLNVHITGIYTFHPFCRDLRILLRDFRGVGKNYYDIKRGGLPNLLQYYIGVGVERERNQVFVGIWDILLLSLGYR